MHKDVLVGWLGCQYNLHSCVSTRRYGNVMDNKWEGEMEWKGEVGLLFFCHQMDNCPAIGAGGRSHFLAFQSFYCDTSARFFISIVISLENATVEMKGPFPIGVVQATRVCNLANVGICSWSVARDHI